MRAELSRVLQLLGAGWRLALLGPARPLGFEVTPVSFLVVVALGTLASCGLAWLTVEPPRAFSRWGVQSEGFYALVVLALCFVLAEFLRARDRMLALAALIFSADLFAGTVTTLFMDHLLARVLAHDARLYAPVVVTVITWYVFIWHRALTALVPGSPERRAVGAAGAVLVLAALPFSLQPMRMWDRDYAALYEQERQQERQEPTLIGEEIFPMQAALLERALAPLEPQTPGRPDLYFVAFGPYGDQDVFLKESLYSSRLFERRFGTRGRTLTLVNNEQKVDELPLATVTNLDHALKAIGARMDPAEDILFLFLTSHGSRDGSLSVSLGDLSFRPLTAPVLATVLAESGIRWKVLVVSGCYSGTFLDALKDDRAVVISAARADRTSFGCSDGAEFTYFGRAFFEQALNHTASFTEAFAIASKLVAEWETKENRERSEPQMVAGPLIEAHLAHWRETLKE
jgi:hypothetical protein